MEIFSTLSLKIGVFNFWSCDLLKITVDDALEDFDFVTVELMHRIISLWWADQVVKLFFRSHVIVSISCEYVTPSQWNSLTAEVALRDLKLNGRDQGFF